MLFSLNEIVQWIGLTVFEIWINLLTITVFSVLLALKLDGVLDKSWWTIFAPLFVSDAMNAYFCCIIFTRMNLENSYKASMYRASWSSIFLGLTFVFKFLLCKKLMGQSTVEYSEVFAPLFILLQLIAKYKIIIIFGFLFRNMDSFIQWMRAAECRGELEKEW